MTTALITHPDCLNHVTPQGHPERVARLKAIAAALDAPEFDALDRVDAPLCEDAHITLAHPPEYLAAIKAASPNNGTRSLDADTHMSPGSLQAAFRAVGGNIKAVDLVVSGQVQNAFVAARPPGHHAEKATAMGFCLFGNVAIAAKHALEHHNLARVAIVDFDVHHGNGTQDLVWEDKRIFFASTHQMPLYPGSGAAHETGGHNNVLNVPLKEGTNGQTFRAKMRDVVLPAVTAFNPEMLFISAGFDAHRDDPLAGLNLLEDDFAWVTGQICDIADQCADGRLVSTLEGGYDLEALAASAAAHVKVLIGRT
ncbi:MAG: histone deacetylase family protein [Alphaproteobacteria bacterium]|nr:histone deacetylase family protein [Alphaproteobacteria bacterium]